MGALLGEVRMTWKGLPGGDGFTVLHCLTGQEGNMVANWRSAMESLKANFPLSVSIVYPTGGDVFDESNGKNQGAWTSAQQTTTVGTNNGPWAATTGAVIRWDAGAWHNGRHVRGRTFLVPLASVAIGTGGIASAFITSANTAVGNFITLMNNTFVVWHRPVYDRTTTPPTLKDPGLGYPVKTGVCQPQAVYLSGRRDA